VPSGGLRAGPAGRLFDWSFPELKPDKPSNKAGKRAEFGARGRRRGPAMPAPWNRGIPPPGFATL